MRISYLYPPGVGVHDRFLPVTSHDGDTTVDRLGQRADLIGGFDDERAQTDCSALEGNLTGLDLLQVEEILDQLEQMGTRGADLTEPHKAFSGQIL